MKKAIRRAGLTQDALAQLRQPLAELLRTTLLETVITAGPFPCFATTIPNVRATATVRNYLPPHR